MDLDAIPAVDQHAHNVLREEVAGSIPFPSFFSEGSGSAILAHHARGSLFFRRSIREIASLLGCPPSEEAIVSRRRELGLERLTELCFGAANLEAILLDDGFMAKLTQPVSWHGRFGEAQRILRLEALAEDL